MFYALSLLFVCTALAYLSANKQYVGAGNSRRAILQRVIDLSSIAFFAMLIIMVCFAGLRSFVNDTASYLSAYEKKIPSELAAIRNIDWAIGSNPLFSIYQIVLKSVFSANGHMFIFVSSLITVTPMVLFIRKYAENFGFSIYLFLAFIVFAFTCAAIKQTMATAIGIWAVPLFLNKKRIKAALLILIAMLIHPYVLVLFAFFFLHKNIWDIRAVIVIGITIVISFVFTSFVESMINFTSLLGENYDISSFDDNKMNIFRVLVYLVTPVLSFAFRKKIREKNNEFLNVCVNLSFVSACFVVLSMFGGAIALGRVACYFDIFTCIALPSIISCGLSNIKEKSFVTVFAFLGFFGFYLTYYIRFYPTIGDMFSDWYCHVSILELF